MFRVSRIILALSLLVGLPGIPASRAVAQPSYREKQERLYGQFQRRKPEKKDNINLFDPKSVNTYAGKKIPVEKEDVFTSISSTFQGASNRGPLARFVGFALLAAVFAGCGVYVYYSRYVWGRMAKDSYDDPRALFRELCRVHDLDRDEQKFIRRFALDMEIEDTLLVFIDPLFFDMAIHDRLFSDDIPLLRRLRTRIFGRFENDIGDGTAIIRERLPIELTPKERYKREQAARTVSTSPSSSPEESRADSSILNTTIISQATPAPPPSSMPPFPVVPGDSQASSRTEKTGNAMSGDGIQRFGCADGDRLRVSAVPSRSGGRKIGVKGGVQGGVQGGALAIQRTGLIESFSEVLLDLGDMFRNGTRLLGRKFMELAVPRRKPPRDTISYVPKTKSIPFEETFVSDRNASRNAVGNAVRTVSTNAERRREVRGGIKKPPGSNGVLETDAPTRNMPDRTIDMRKPDSPELDALLEGTGRERRGEKHGAKHEEKRKSKSTEIAFLESLLENTD